MKNVVRISVCLLFAVLIFSTVMFAQTPSPSPSPTPPAADIFIIDLKGEGKLKLGQPIKITSEAGYNNQPSFMPDGRSILYTSIKDKQADIYRYDINSGATTQITRTPESEFSPT